MNTNYLYPLMVALLLTTMQTSNGQIIGQGSTPETVVFAQSKSVETKPRVLSALSRMSFMLDAGYNWRIGKISNELDDFQKHLVRQNMSGFQWNGSAAYYFGNRICGVGVKFHQFLSSYEMFGEIVETGQTGLLKISDRITYVGPAFMMQAPLGRSKMLVDGCAGFGYLGYQSKHFVINKDGSISGATLGAHMAAGFSYKFSSNWSIGAKFALTSGVIFEYTLTDHYGNKTVEKLEAGQGEGLAQFSISLGIRHYIN